MFISLGCLFAGIAIGTNTFGRERVVKYYSNFKVYWRDTATGMPTIPYFLAKVIIDIPRMVMGALFFSIAVALFFPYRQSWGSLYVVILLLYFVSFGMGYWISTAFPVQKASLIGVGFALLWALVLSGVVPNYTEVVGDGTAGSGYPPAVQWLWSISAPRWAVEAFWLMETAKVRSN